MLTLCALGFAATLTGHVADPDGEPVAGVTVVAYDVRLNYATATTTSSGTWTIRNIPGGAYRLRSYGGDSSPWVDRFYPSAWDFCTSEAVSVGEDEMLGDLDITVPRGGTLAGVLTDLAGNPAVGVEVTARGTSERTALATRTGLTDETGAFVIPGLDSDPGAPEPYACLVDAPGWPEQFFGPVYDEDSADLFEVTLGASAETGTHALLDGITVAGTVYGPDGPVTGGTVFIYSPSQILGVTIDDDGTYVGDGLPPGDVIAWAESDGLATTYYPDADRPGERVSVTEEGAVQEGVDLQLPVESTLTVRFSGDGDVAEVGVLLYNSELTVGRGGGVDDSGAIRIDALFEGDYTLYIYGADGGFTDGWATEGGATRVFHVSGDMEVDIPLGRGASVSGTVTDENGAPVYGAYVYVYPADGSDASAVATEADGTYRVLGLQGGDVTVRTNYVNYCPTDPGYVLEYWEDAYQEADADYLSVPAGEALEGIDVVLLLDGDHDGMGDTWEQDNGLDATRDDGAEDPDGDGYTNYDEWILGSNPLDASSGKDGGCGCGGGAAAALMLLPGLAWTVRRRRTRRTR